MRPHSVIFVLLMLVALGTQCNKGELPQNRDGMAEGSSKIVIYQVFTRLFGNTRTTNKPWGTLEENGVGKFVDFTSAALREIKTLGVTHIWYTGVLHHAVITDYSAYGISPDDPDVVKGRAGSPYAVKDYFNVDPDLAVEPDRRLEEFRELIDRTHSEGLKLLIDIVPNHIARRYEGRTNPPGVEDFGSKDDTSVIYARDNNFYYLPGESFRVPDFPEGMAPLGGEPHPLADGFFEEEPAKWTGNGARRAQPDINDWYETVKINYGVRPDGQKDFPQLPPGFAQKGTADHFSFWQNKDVPDSWKKFRDIALYWLAFGVDGFRFDMAEMVPVEFWSYLNSAIKSRDPDALLLAEVYDPDRYRDYIHRGKMDYLYDKVQLYDTLKAVMQGHGSTDAIPAIQEDLADIEHHMLHFLENHDEQRIASPAFAGDAAKGKPAMVVSATIGSSPTMIYFGQEVGEPGAQDAGFGKPSRTSIFDYIGVPHHQRWMNEGEFDGGKLNADEKALRAFYRKLLNFTLGSPALDGAYREIHRFNRQHAAGYTDRVFAFLRWSEEEKLIIVSNFDAQQSAEFELLIPEDVLDTWEWNGHALRLEDQLGDEARLEMKPVTGGGSIDMRLLPLQSLILRVSG